MPLSTVVLDSTPLGLLTQRDGKSHLADDCRTWLERLIESGIDVRIPEIADYEVRRELTRAKLTYGLSRLDNLIGALSYLPITTSSMRQAALLWAQARNSGLQTASDNSLDGDVILAAQAISINLPSESLVVATSNPRHLSRFVAAEFWQEIR